MLPPPHTLMAAPTDLVRPVALGATRRTNSRPPADGRHAPMADDEIADWIDTHDPESPTPAVEDVLDEQRAEHEASEDSAVDDAVGSLINNTDLVVDIIEQHGPGGTEAEDGVHLELR